MGFFDFIRKLTGTDEDSKVKRLNNRITQLQKEKSNHDKELEKLKNTPSPDLSRFSIPPSVSQSDKVVTFTPRNFGTVRTMKDLLEKRKREEEERLKQLKSNALKCFDSIRSLLEAEEVNNAENLLFQIAPIIKEIKDNSLQTTFDDCKVEIANLKETLRQREIERREKEARERAEREERERLERLRRQEAAERERQEKERKAREYEEKLAREEQARALEIARLKAEVTREKDNAQAFINYLRSHGVSCFYHFTDESNLRSIRKLGGLYSWYYCVQNNIDIPDAGGDSQSRGLDRRQGLEDYVRLSFCSDHPMAWRKQQEGSHLVLLRIKIDVAAFKDTQFSNVNAAANNNRHGKTLEDLQRVNISATQRHFVSRDEDIFHEHQAECMVKTFIPIEYITNINSPSRIS